MQIISMVSHRDKAPTNALIAKAVEICANKGIPQLLYGTWADGGIGDFRSHNGFLPLTVPRYYIPLTKKGQILLRLHLHRAPAEFLPYSILKIFKDLRSKWYRYRFQNHRLGSSATPSRESHVNL
jgi:hypothetical protein